MGAPPSPLNRRRAELSQPFSTPSANQTEERVGGVDFGGREDVSGRYLLPPSPRLLSRMLNPTHPSRLPAAPGGDPAVCGRKANGK